MGLTTSWGSGEGDSPSERKLSRKGITGIRKKKKIKDLYFLCVFPCVLLFFGLSISHACLITPAAPSVCETMQKNI